MPAGVNGQEPADELSDLVDKICAEFDSAQKHYVTEHKSTHWDIFSEEYRRRLGEPEVWENFRNNGLTSGLDIGFQWRRDEAPGPKPVSDPKLIADYLRRYESLKAAIGRDFIRDHHEAVLGNPEFVAHDDLKINVTDLRHLHDAWRIHDVWSKLVENRDPEPRPVIIDIGGGFGGLAAKLKRLFPKALIILFDLPEVNAMQTYFLHKSFPNADFACHSDIDKDGFSHFNETKLDFIVLPAWMIDSMAAESVDIAINTRSMMEMTPPIVAQYMASINRLVRRGGIFYCVNRYIRTHPEGSIRIKDYGFDANWYFAVSQPAWDQPWLHEVAAVRTTVANAQTPLGQLNALPPYSWRDLGKRIRNALMIFRHLTWGGHHNVNPGARGSVFLGLRALEHRAVTALKRHPSIHRLARKIAGRS